MSANPASSGHADASHVTGEAHGSLRRYLIGFILAAILTAIPFWLVMANVLDNKQVTGIVIMVFAAVQVVVHMI